MGVPNFRQVYLLKLDPDIARSGKLRQRRYVVQPRLRSDADDNRYQRAQLITSVRGQKLSDEQVESGIFHSMTFCERFIYYVYRLTPSDIPKGSTKHSKTDLEALVHKHGGDYTQQQLGDMSAYVISPDNKSR